MQQINHRHTFFIGGLILVLSLIVLLINNWLYQFPGTNYFPENMLILSSTLGLIYLGVYLIFNKNSRLTRATTHLIYLFGVMAIIAFATNAIQLTPFSPIDHTIISFEALFNINMASIVSWTAGHQAFKDVLVLIYDSLPYQMCLIPIFVIIMGRFILMNDYYFLLLFTALIGFSFYYFFPTTAPASIISSPLFSAEQLATGLKFQQIHSYIRPTTIEGGLIALPSFHCIWAILCTYLLKEWQLLFIPFIIINSLLILSCVLLGWHYPIDIIAGSGLAFLSIYFVNRGNSLRVH